MQLRGTVPKRLTWDYSLTYWKGFQYGELLSGNQTDRQLWKVLLTAGREGKSSNRSKISRIKVSLGQYKRCFFLHGNARPHLSLGTWQKHAASWLACVTPPNSIFIRYCSIVFPLTQASVQWHFPENFNYWWIPSHETRCSKRVLLS